jgi:hypothetical protein
VTRRPAVTGGDPTACGHGFTAVPAVDDKSIAADTDQLDAVIDPGVGYGDQPCDRRVLLSIH